MADLKPLQHEDVDKKDDATLRLEARAQLSRFPALQVVGDLLARLRSRDLSWWSAEDLRVFWPARERMRWLRDRPDLRAQITTALTQLPARAARKKTAEFQADLLESFLEDGDITVKQFEESFDPFDFVTYGPVADVWRKFRERMPWHDDSKPNQEIVAALLRSLLAHAPISALDVRSAISPAVWQAKIPLDVRIAIDEARLRREKAGEPFGAAQELAVATPEVVVSHIPLRELAPVFDVAQKALGWDSISTPRSTPPLRVVEPMCDPDEILASISRRAANTSHRSSVPPPVARPRNDDEKTQPRIQVYARS